PDGQQLYSTGADGQIKLWNTGDGGLVKSFIDSALPEKAHRDFGNQLRLTKDGSKLVAVGHAGWFTVWNTADGKLIHSQKMPSGWFRLPISPDSKTAATGNQKGTVYVVKLP